MPPWQLQSPITDIFNANAGAKPILCGKPGYVQHLRTTLNKAEQPISVFMVERLLTVLAAKTSKAPPPALEPDFGAEKLADALAMTIATFNSLTEAKQREFISNIWKRLVLYKIPSIEGQAMTEPAGNVTPRRDPLPSSLAPVNPAQQQVTLRRRVATAWRNYGVGFRVDGKKNAVGDEFDDRVRANGCQPLTHNRASLRAVRGWNIDDLYVAQQDRVFIWCGNRDVMNETGICVSRSLFGATAFPERTTDSGAEGVTYHYLLAVDCNNLRGVDTEAWQLSLGVASNWRPGEKVFLGIGPERILGWTKLLRQPGQPGGGWIFMFPETNWNWVNQPNQITTAYLNEELQAWQANTWYTVPGDYDFA
jgi:hypothetical protein